MARRLSVARPATQGSLLLPDVPRPDRLRAGTCGLVRALWATALHAGVRTDYDALMGFTGIAFALPAGVDLAPTPGDALRCEHIAQALAALGLSARWMSLDPQEPAAAVAAVEESLRAGFAVPVLGWPAEGDGWAVITGSDPARGVLCGWPARPSTEVYLGSAPRAEALVAITGRLDQPDPAGALLAAFSRAADARDRVAEGYRRWVEYLLEEDAWSGEVAERVLRHETLSDDLADARTSAAALCEVSAEDLGAAAGEWLGQAAEHAARIVAALEDRDPPIGDPESARALRSAQWRRDWADTVQALAAADAQLLACLAGACRGDDGPGPSY